MKNKELMYKANCGPYEIMEAEIDALWEIVESLPVDPHDMGVHFWCSADNYCVTEDDEEE